MQDKEKAKTKEKKKFRIKIILSAVFILLSMLIYYSLPCRIVYRPKSHCSRAESDANNIAAAISDYFSNPEHTILPTINGESEYLGFTLSPNKGKGQNIAWVTGHADSTIAIVVQDGSGKCPDDYQKRFDQWDSGKYTKIMY